MAIPYFTDVARIGEDGMLDSPPTLKALMDKLDAAMRTACEHMDTAKLTEDEKVAIAMFSGAKYDVNVTPATDDKGWSMKIEVEPCAVVAVNGKWHVYTRSKQP